MPAQDDETYYTADRRVGVLLGALSLTATQISAGTLIGTVGIHYTVGVGFAGIWFGIWAGWLVSMAYIAPQLRAAGGFTVSNFLASRFGSGDGHVRGVAAAFVAAIYLVYTTAQYLAGGILLETVFGVEQLVGTVAIAAVALSYTVVGGMLFSVYSDAIQVTAMVGGLVAAAAVGLANTGSLAGTLSAAAAVDPALLSPTGAPALTVGLALSFGFGITVAPFELSRVYAMRDPETVRRAIPVSILLQAVVAACVALLGLVARVQFPGVTNPDRAVVHLALDLFGPVVGAALLLAVLAAILSTVDSVLLVSSSAIAHDLFAEALPASGLVATVPSERRVLTVARVATVAAAVVPVGLTFVSGAFGGLIQLIVALYTSLLAGTLFVPVVAGLYRPRATKPAVLAGMTCGGTTVFAWQLARDAALPPPFAAVDPVVPGLLVSAVALVGATLVTE